MSKRINVNPGQYKVAGRDRMGENEGTQAQQKAQLGQEKARLERGSAKTPNPPRKKKS